MFGRLLRFGLAAVFSLCATAASATALLNIGITTAVTTQVSPVVELPRSGKPTNVELEAEFAYGSGGTTVDAWVQTSLDGQNTWVDVAEFHFTTSATKGVYNLSSLTPVTTQYAPTTGTLSANTAKDGIVGSYWRVEYTTTGTYAGSTNLTVNMFANGVTAPSP